MMEISDIARVTYELMRQREDRLLKTWEDDRGHLLREVHRLQKVHERDVRTTEKLRQEMSIVTDKIYQLAAASVGTGEGGTVTSQHTNRDRGQYSHKRVKSTRDQSVEENLESFSSKTAKLTADKKVPHPGSIAPPSVSSVPARCTAMELNHDICSLGLTKECNQVCLSPPHFESNTMTSDPSMHRSGNAVATSGSSRRDKSRRSKDSHSRRQPSVYKSMHQSSASTSSPPNATTAAAISTTSSLSPTTASSSTAAGGAVEVAAIKPYLDTGGRKRDIRDMLDGHECEECKRYYRVMEQQGLITDSMDLKETLRKCSRHKSRWEAPATPEGYWDLSIQTPEDWTLAHDQRSRRKKSYV